MKITDPRVRSLALAVVVGVTTFLCLWLVSRAPGESARLRSVEARTASDQRTLLSHRGAPLVTLVCRDRREADPNEVRRRLQQAAGSASAKLSDLVVNRLQTSAGGTVATAPVEFGAVVPTKSFPKLLEALGNSRTPVFYDDVDLTRAPGGGIVVEFKGRVICDASAAP